MAQLPSFFRALLVCKGALSEYVTRKKILNKNIIRGDVATVPLGHATTLREIGYLLVKMRLMADHVHILKQHMNRIQNVL